MHGLFFRMPPYWLDDGFHPDPRFLINFKNGVLDVQKFFQGEVELMQERGASPILHIDFTRADLITEDNILQINMRQGGRTTGGRSRSKG